MGEEDEVARSERILALKTTDAAAYRRRPLLGCLLLTLVIAFVTGMWHLFETDMVLATRIIAATVVAGPALAAAEALRGRRSWKSVRGMLRFALAGLAAIWPYLR